VPQRRQGLKGHWLLGEDGGAVGGWLLSPCLPSLALSNPQSQESKAAGRVSPLLDASA